jgi:hypothetical protein
MSASPSSRSPLARLVLFMVCLAIAGSFVAGAHYVVVDLPQQKVLTAPENSDEARTCWARCLTAYELDDYRRMNQYYYDRYIQCLNACPED